MLNNFIYAQTKDLFLEKLNAGEVLDEAIVFIEDTKEIWNHGHYFAGESIDPELLEQIQGHILYLDANKPDNFDEILSILQDICDNKKLHHLYIWDTNQDPNLYLGEAEVVRYYDGEYRIINNVMYSNSYSVYNYIFKTDGTYKRYAHSIKPALKEDVIDKLDKMINVTYSELVALRDNAQLVPGQQYRITDYVTTTAQLNTQSAGHQFDVIVTADDEKTLNEVARACHSEFNIEKYKDGYSVDMGTSVINSKMQYVGIFTYGQQDFYLYESEQHDTQMLMSFEGSSKVLESEGEYMFAITATYVRWKRDSWSDWVIELSAGIAFKYDPNEGLSYFNNSNLAAWKIWYSLDNDVERFTWADTDNGKGVIYRMIDEWGNDCPYDFKNIQFKGILILDENKFYYTFNNEDDDATTYDASLNIPKEDTYTYTYTSKGSVIATNNKISSYSESCRYDFPRIIFHSTNDGDWVFKNNVFKENCHHNVMLKDCSNNIFGNSCNNNSFGTGCSNNTFGNNCNDNTFENKCSNNSFGNNCDSNTFGDSCYSNSFGSSCDRNSFGDNCYYNSFGNGCNDNSFGNDCRYNRFSNDCYSNSFGNYCTSNSFGSSCNHNSFVNGCSNNSFGNNCDSNTFGDGCDYNSFGNECSRNTFGDDCNINSFGNSCNVNRFNNNCYKNSFGNDCSCNTFGDACHSNGFGNNCCYNSFGNGCSINSFGNYCNHNSFRTSASETATLLNYCQYNHFDDSCSYNVIWNSVQPTSSNKLQNINVVRGVSGTYSTYNFINIVEKNANHEIKVAKNSNGEIKVYCEADLIA